MAIEAGEEEEAAGQRGTDAPLRGEGEVGRGVDDAGDGEDEAAPGTEREGFAAASGARVERAVRAERVRGRAGGTKVERDTEREMDQ